MFEDWIQPAGKTIKDVGEIKILEQYLLMLSRELQVWIREHDPPSASKAASLAEVFVAARKKGQPWTFISRKASKETHKFAHLQHQPKMASGVGKAPLRENHLQSSTPKHNHKIPVCYLCGQEGYSIKPMCPQNPPKLT